MKKYKKASSSPLVLVVPLVIAVIVVIAAAVISNTKIDTRSKASYSIAQQCVNWCNDLITKKNDSFKTACATRCPAVEAGTMTCGAFCNGAPMVRLCQKKCALWTNPCTTDKKGICNVATSEESDLCIDECTLVVDGEKTCREAFIENEAFFNDNGRVTASQMRMQNRCDQILGQ